MNLIKLVDTMIHSVPIIPSKLQGTWLDTLWDRIENCQKRKIQNMPTMAGELVKKNKLAR